MVVATATAAAQPSVVVILADDLGYGDIGANGGTTIATPHIDALAARGVRLTQGYVSHPVCSPSRAGLMTGRYQQRHGWEFNPSGRDRVAGMSTEEQTIADVMRAAGYRTGLVGKWHLGSRPEHHPVNRGFDEFFGMVEGGSIYIDGDVPGVESWGSPRVGRPNKIIRGLDQEVVVEEYLTDRFTDEAVDFIERHARVPFFLFLSHKTPHTPLQATAKYLDRSRHIDDDATRIYSAMVASLDDSVGAVVAALEGEGLRDDTLIVFLSDNGCAGYVANACSNAPLRGSSATSTKAASACRSSSVGPTPCPKVAFSDTRR
ncbi:MAG: sulfatase-like hydrolase/transferase [Gammaproteobacteria bacterium]|nr:sulfatase-like hydrolase/transferase [Gammaproteobacteria bacterium]